MPFVAEENRGREFPIPFPVRLFCFGGGPDDPDVTFFQLLYQSNQVRYASNRNVFERACCDLRNNTRQAHRTSLGDEYSVNARTFCRTHDRTEVMWIFNPVQSYNQRRIRSSDFAFEQVQQL